MKESSKLLKAMVEFLEKPEYTVNIRYNNRAGTSSAKADLTSSYGTGYWAVQSMNSENEFVRKEQKFEIKGYSRVNITMTKKHTLQGISGLAEELFHARDIITSSHMIPGIDEYGKDSDPMAIYNLHTLAAKKITDWRKAFGDSVLSTGLMEFRQIRFYNKWRLEVKESNPDVFAKIPAAREDKEYRKYLGYPLEEFRDDKHRGKYLYVTRKQKYIKYEVHKEEDFYNKYKDYLKEKHPTVYKKYAEK